MDTENLIDLLDSLIDLSREGRKLGYSSVSYAAARLALNVAQIELDGYQPQVKF